MDGEKMNDLKIATLNKATASQDIGTASYSGNADQEITIFNPYGLVTCAPECSRLILIPLNGNESNMYALVDKIDRGSIPTPEPGETILANYISGDYIHLKTDDMEFITSGNLKIKSAGLDIETGAFNLKAASSNISGGGDFNISGGDVKADGISLKNHPHGGVTTGGDDTGKPK